MAGLNIADLETPQWWPRSAPPLKDVLPAAMDAQKHRERWKYTLQAKVLDLIWNADTESGSDVDITHFSGLEVSTTADGAQYLSQEKLLATAPETVAALSLAGLRSLRVPNSHQAILHIHHRQPMQPTVIHVGANAQLELEETYSLQSPGYTCLWLILEQGAQVKHARNTLHSASQLPLQTWQYLRTELKRDASYSLNNHSMGDALQRQDLQIALLEPGAHAEITASACISSGAHLDQQTTVEHVAGNTTSQQVVHNIANDAAKVTFNGRIHIHPQAPGSAAHLTNRNICLGDATINTKPELEIYTDDVQCSHGATIGQLDDAHRFYCQSRGIDPLQTKHLLSKAFLQQATLGPLAGAALEAYFQALSL